MAKINRITRSSSSLVTLAELQSGSELFTKTTIRKTQITPELTGTAALVKRAEVIRRVIDRIVYNDTVSGVQVFAEYLLTTDSPLLLFIRGRFVDDIVGLTDDADLLPGKGFDEIVNTQEQSKLLVQFFRVFEDAALMQSRTALRLDKPLPVDLVSTADLPSLEPGLNIFDVLQAQEISRLLVAFARTFEDAVIVEEDIQSFNITKSLLDDYAALDQSQLVFGKTLADLVAEFDAQSLVVDKALADVVIANEQLQRSLALVKADAVGFTDRQALFVALTKTDTTVPVDVTLLLPGKSLVDLQDIADNAAKSVFKALADTIIPQDLAGVFDGITYNYGLSRTFDVAVADVFRSATNYFRPLDDTISLSDLIIVGQGKFRVFADLVSMLDTNALLFGLANRDTQTLSDAVVRAHAAARSLEDSQVVDELKALSLNKALFDDVSMQDLFLFELFKLVSLFDFQFTEDRLFLNVVKSLANSASLLDQFIIAQVKAVSDDTLVDEFKTMFIVKALADTAITEDLAGVFDGITYSYGLSRTETLLTLDDFSRVFSAQRVFEDILNIDDEFRRVYGKNIFLDDTQDAPTDFISLLPGIGVRDSVGDITVYIDSLYDLMYDREVGQNFTSSLLFNAASAGSNVQVTSSGTGSGQFEGFYAPAIPYVGPGTGAAAGGNYVLFTGADTRTLATVPLDTTTGQNVVFTFIAGNTSNGGDRPEAGENLILEYSTDLGTSYTTTATIWTGATLWPDGANWRTTSIAMPLASKTTSTIWRWRETGTPTDPGDNYGLFNIYVGSTSVVQIRTLPETRFFDIGKALQDTQDQTDSVRRAHAAVRGARDGFADVLDLRTYAFPAIVTSNVTSLVTEYITSSDAQRYSLPSNNTWQYIAALTTSVFVISRTDGSTSWGVRSTSAGLTWNAINFVASKRKFASDNLAGNTSISVGIAGSSFYKSNNQGSSWALVATPGNDGLETDFYYPFFDIHRRVWFTFQRDQGTTGGKSPQPTQQWKYFYSDPRAESWSGGTFYTTSNTSSGLFPIGVASRNAAGSGDMILVTRNGAVWSLLSSTVIGSALSLSVARLEDWPGEFDPADRPFVASDNNRTYVVLHNNGVVYRASSLTTWYSSTLVGAASGDTDGVFWDPSISSFVIFGETGAGLPTFWTSTTGANWSSSTAILGRAFIDGASILGAYVPGTNTTGTSTLVAFEIANTVSSAMRIQRYLVPYSYTSLVSIGTAQPTPRTADLPSATFYDVNKTAKQSIVSTVTIKTADNSTSTGIGSQSSVTLTRTANDVDLVGSVDLFTRQINVARTNELAVVAADAERADITKLLPETVVAAPGGVGQRIVSGFSSITTTTTSVTSSSSIQINAYTTSEITITSMTGYPSGGPWANALVWDTSNQSQFSSGAGYEVYDHFLFTTNAASRHVTSKFLPGLSSVTIFYIAGGSPNGGNVPEVGDNLILEYNQTGNTWTTAAVLRFGGSSTATTWTQTSISLSLGNDATRIRVRQTANSGTNTDQYGIGPTTVTGSRTSTLVTFATSVSVQTTGFGNYGSSVEVGEVAKDIDLRAYRGAVGSTPVKTIDGTVPIIDTTVTITVTSTQSDLTDGYLSSVVSDMVGSVVFNSANSIKANVVAAGTGEGSSGGFDTYRHVFFGGGSILSGEGRWITSNPLDLRDAEQITFQWIRGTGTNGRNSNSGSLPLYFQILPSPGLSTTAESTIYAGSGGESWTTRTINLSAAQRTSAALIRFRNDATVSNSDVPHVGLTNVRIVRRTYSTSYSTSYGIAALLDWQQSSTTINRGARSIDDVGTIDSWSRILDVKRVYEDQSPALDQEFYSITKSLDDLVSIEDSYSVVTDGLTYDGTKFFNDNVIAGLGIAPRVSGSDVERTAFDVSIIARASVGYSVSSIAVLPQESDRIFIGQQYTGAYQAGDGLERISLQPNLGEFETVLSGSGVDQTRGNDLERLTFNITQLKTEIAQAGFGTDAPGIRLHGDDLERTAFDITLRAYRGVDGSVTLNTIDPSPDVEFQVSSVTINRGARSVDDVGILDSFFLTYAVGRLPEDFISVGRNIDDGVRRFNPAINSETVVFAITKLIGDAVIPDDFLQTFDGLTYRATLLLRETVLAGLNIAPRVSGSDVERTVFDITLLMKQGSNNTVSGVTIAAAARGETVRVGQQSFAGNVLGFRSSRDGQERISFDVTKLADAINNQFVTAGIDYDQRSANQERVLFSIGKRATLGTDPVILGFGGTNFGARVSGDDLERTTFNVTLVMKQGANNTVSGVTRAASATGETVRVGQQYGLIRFSRDAQERIAFDYSKNLPAGSNNTTIVALDTVRPASAYRRPFDDLLSALGEKDGNFRYALTQGARIEDLTASDEIIISNLLFRTLESVLQQGDLDPFGNINTMVSNGFLRMTDYVDIEYLENDYVGESRSFS